MNNRILKALPAKEYRILYTQLKEVMLLKGAILHEGGERIGQEYFPNDEMISYLSRTALSGSAEGESVDVCVVGNEEEEGCVQ